MRYSRCIFAISRVDEHEFQCGSHIINALRSVFRNDRPSTPSREQPVIQASRTGIGSRFSFNHAATVAILSISRRIGRDRHRSIREIIGSARIHTLSPIFWSASFASFLVPLWFGWRASDFALPYEYSCAAVFLCKIANYSIYTRWSLIPSSFKLLMQGSYHLLSCWGMLHRVTYIPNYFSRWNHECSNAWLESSMVLWSKYGMVTFIAFENYFSLK